MQKNINGHYLYSPSDLVRFVDSPFASKMERLLCEGEISRELKNKQTQDAELLTEGGFAHERKFEEKLSKAYKIVTKIAGNTLQEKQDNTIKAMQSGDEVIVQGYLSHLPFAGYADFLIKVSGASKLGDYHYEVWDTKLSHRVKPEYLIQLCCYAEMLKEIQGVLPEYLTIALGNDQNERIKTIDCFAYYQAIKAAFLQEQNGFDKTQIPHPADYKEWGQWSDYAKNLLVEEDHLFQVANIRYQQIQKLNQAGIKTLAELAKTNLQGIKGINQKTFERLKQQAELQEKAKAGELAFRIIKPNQNELTGLALLPPHSASDVYFDIEGFPFEKDGLEYLWGVTYFEGGERCFNCYWAHDREQEKQAFEDFITWVYQRWQNDKSMHIYHYASYEITACRKLMGRFGVCEYKVDELLRHGVFVDLYQIVRSGLLAGLPKYSIKDLEPLYHFKREGEVANGGDSIVAYDEYRKLWFDGQQEQAELKLDAIKAYNKKDCDSTQELTFWLRKQQQDHHIDYMNLNATTRNEKNKTEEEQEKELEKAKKQAERDKSRQSLLSRAKTDTQLQMFNNLAWMLDFHEREAKPVWWRLFDRLGLTEDELFDDLECLALCQRTQKAPFKPTAKARNLAYQYTFDTNQEFKGVAKNFYVLGEYSDKGKELKVSCLKEHSDLKKGVITVQCSQELPQLMTLIPDDFVNPEPIPLALKNVIDDIGSGSQQHLAIQQFLARERPVIDGHTDNDIVVATEPQQRLNEIIKVVENLQNSYLVIQGPPGAGKSYTAKHIIAELLKSGKKIGISSNSHKAINHLLLTTMQYCQHKGITAHFVYTKEDEALERQQAKRVENAQLHNQIQNACVLGTTAWGFAREDMTNQLDYLFVDEAGQVAVANLIAMSRSAKNMILMGDQMQLGQPLQGTHPLESGSSILDYLLRDQATIDNSMGVFLSESYRMHSAVNQYISEYIYDGKLHAHPDNDQQLIHLPNDYQGELNKEAGVVFVPVHHQGNTQASDEEVDKIKSLVDELLTRKLTTKEGETRQVTWQDILFIAPYNHQVRKLQDELGSQAKVGSVDKFQGQEAPIVFLSMCTSDAGEAPRGLDFLFNKNRLNVAVSRAKSLAIIVASPQLQITKVNSVEQLKKVNLFCGLVQERAIKD